MFKFFYCSKSITAPIVIMIAALFVVGCSKKIAPVGGSTGLSNEGRSSVPSQTPTDRTTSNKQSPQKDSGDIQASNEGMTDEKLAKRIPIEDRTLDENGRSQGESSRKQGSENQSPRHDSQRRHDDASGSQTLKNRGSAFSNGGPVFIDNVYFDYDQALVRNDAKEALEENSRWLALNSDIRIQIEGHGDERGTNDYNLALGERRARSIMRYMINLGIDKSRFSFISYGEERSVCGEQKESCYQKNRRVHFFVKK